MLIKSKKGFKTMTNLKATKEEHQKRRDTFTNIKKHWAKNDTEIEEIREEISELYNTIDRFREQIRELSNEGHEYYKNNFRRYYPDKLGKILETDTQQERHDKENYWRN
jgi:septal ring factor EnvC (AmiA/AmiB activator)|tara:strand:- start:12 stop:338 length:327 start_codon:yes stop_codon:yes gene_type:complete